MNIQISMIIARDKIYIGKMDVDALGPDGITLTEALEVREMMVPTEQGQIQRMINFTTISPFDKSTHTVIIPGLVTFVKLEENSDSIKAYEQFKAQFNKVQLVDASALNNLGAAGFGGRFTPNS